MVDLTKYSDDELQAMLKQTQTAPASTEEGPSTLADVRDSAAAGLAQGSLAIPGMIGDIPTMAGKATEKVGEWLGSEGVQHAGQSIAGLAPNYTTEAFEKSADPYLQKVGVDVNYQPQTAVGRYARTAGQFLPSTVGAGLFGPEAMASALTRGAGAAVGSETLGHAVEDFTGEGSTAGAIARAVGGIGGAGIAPRAVTPFPTSPARTAMAQQLQQDIKPFGGNVNATQATGSPRVSQLSGPSSDQSQAVTEALFNKAGIPYQPGQPYKPILNQANQQWKQDMRAAETGAAVNRDPQLGRDAWDIKQRAEGTLTGKSQQSALDEFNSVYHDLWQMPPKGVGAAQLSGRQYLNLRNDMRDSNNPFVNQLGDAFERSANRTPGAPWQALNERYANIKGLKAGAEGAGPLNGPMDPADVVGGMKAQTPMKDTATAAGTILKDVPPAPATGIGRFGGAALGAALGAHGGVSGMLAGGTEGGVLGLLLSERADQAAQNMARLLANTKTGQAYMKNQALLPGQHYNPWLSRQLALQNARQGALLLGPPSLSTLQKSGSTEE